MMTTMTTTMTTTTPAKLRIRMALAFALAAAALASVAATPAHAHAELVATSPVEAAVVNVSPRKVSVTFNEPVTVAAGGVQLLSSQGRVLARSAAADDATVTFTTPRLGKGRYVVRWRATSADGHPIVQSYSFSVGTPTPAAKPLAGYLTDATGNVAFSLDGSRAGARRAVVNVVGLEGVLEWKHPSFGAPMIWKLTPGKGAVSASGMIPAAGDWTVTARIRVSEFDVRILTGRISVKA